MKNAADSNFCKQCGHRLEKPLAPQFEEPLAEAAADGPAATPVLERAYRLWKQGDTVIAIALCEEAIALRQDSAAAHSLLGQCYESNGNREQAIREYEHALRLNPASISDRIKLDALHSHSDVPSPSFPAPILLDRRNGEGVSRLLIGSVAACGLLFIGSAAVIWSKQMPPSTNSTPPQTALSGDRGAPISSVAALNSERNTDRAGAPAYGPNPPAGPENQSMWRAARNSGNGVPQGSFSGNNARSGDPQPLTRPPMTTVVARDYAKRVGQSGAGNAQGHDSGDRVLITNSDDNNAEGPIVIPVTKTNGQDPKAGHQTPGDPGPRISVTVVPHPMPASSTEGDPSSGTGSATLAIAEDLKRRGDVDKAVVAYRKALSTAGDGSAYVYQQLGQCYQSRGDKNNAIANFQKAIDAYQGLVKVGHQADFALTGIRICKSGIKICAGE